MSERKVVINSDGIFIDGKKTQILSGAIHYFRVIPEYWRDRLDKARAMGLNCVETYFCWNLHEPREGKFDFTGILDCERFIREAAEAGLYVIVRPGPFICAEWSNGGFPAWLTSKPGCRVRRDNDVYMAAVKRFFDVLLPKLDRLTYPNGGPIIMAAVENEYGSYSRDYAYLGKLRDLMAQHLPGLPLITADGGGDQHFVRGGTIDGCPAALTMGPLECVKRFESNRVLRPDSPPMCMEYWCGNFDWHATPHRFVPAEAVAAEYEAMVRYGGSVNLYMFHGGTNFGFNNGANMTMYENDYKPQTTSYDYDAPLDEAGDITPKYLALREVIRKYHPEYVSGREFPPAPKRAYGRIELAGRARLFDNLERLSGGKVFESVDPLTMEEMGMESGFALYSVTLPGPCGTVFDEILLLFKLRDRAQLFLDGTYLGEDYRTRPMTPYPLRIEKDATLDVLVENAGIVNYGPFVGTDSKGIDSVLINRQKQMNYRCRPLPMDDPAAAEFLPWKEGDALEKDTPTLYRFVFECGECCDTWLRNPGVHGVAWINGFNLGRYDKQGPSDALYVPGPRLRKGKNELIVFELHALHGPYVDFADKRGYRATQIDFI